MRRRTAIILLAVLVTVALPVAAFGRDWEDGDVFVGLATGHYNVYDNDGTLQESVDTATAGFTVNCAFDRAGVLHGTAFATNEIVRFLGPHPHTKLAPNLVTGGSPESISFARDGTYFVGHQANPNSLRKRNGVGTEVAQFSPGSPAAMLDLASDQRTMFYTSRSGANQQQVHRFDVQTGLDLPDFANLGGTERTADLKLLPPGDGSGGLLVAQTTEIKRLDGNGTVIKEYDVAGENTWFGVALDPDGKSFWAQTATPGNVYRIDIETGAVDRGPLPSAASAFGICVRGTRTAALDNAPSGIRITTPAPGATFQLGQAVSSDYGCTDDGFGTGVKSCVGPVPSGGPVDTASVGTKTFTVNASDNAGNLSTLTRSYTVVSPPPPPPPPGRVLVTLAFNFDVGRKSTLLRSLRVKGVPAGSRVTAKCKPKRSRRCPGKAVTRRNASGSVRLKAFAKKRYRPGVSIEVRVTKPGLIGAVKRLQIRRRKAPATQTRCLPLGSNTPKRRC